MALRRFSALSPNAAGYLCGFSAYLMWGFFPVYFKLIAVVPPLEILAHRVVWSFLLLLAVVTLRRGWHRVRAALSSPRTALMLAASSTFIGINWFLFIEAVNSGRMLETSLGYFINPLVNVLLGMIFFGERLSRGQWVAVAVAAAGVCYQLVLAGTVPLVSLALAMSFGCYGMVRKKAAVDAEVGLLFETALLAPIGATLILLSDNPVVLMVANPISLNLLLIASGLLTTVPLLCFTAAANRLPLSILGFFQYVSPSTVFLLAVFCYGEAITATKVITFLFIWVALAVFTVDGLRRYRRRRQPGC